MISLFAFLSTATETTAQDPGDWANLQRFEEANAKLDKPQSGEQRVVFMGNSITQGWPDKYPEFWENSNYINRGISGQTTPQMLIRFRQDVIELSPKLVVILAGTNDIAGNTGEMTLDMIQDNFTSMVELALANDIKVLLCSVLPVYDYQWRPGREPAPKIVALNKWMKEYAAAKGIGYVDYHTPMKDNRDGLLEQYTYDGCHPTREGYEVMSAIASKAISKALAR